MYACESESVLEMEGRSFILYILQYSRWRYTPNKDELELKGNMIIADTLLVLCSPAQDSGPWSQDCGLVCDIFSFLHGISPVIS